VTVLDFPTTLHLDRRPGTSPTVTTVQLHDDLWRVTRPDGEVLGYVERAESPGGQRYTAKRMLQRQRRFLPIGEFWSIDDALDCFRF
jgi:hypothetical protein